MFRRFVSTFLSVTAIGIFIGLILCAIDWATQEDVHPDDDVWPMRFALMVISVGTSAVIGVLSGFAMMSRKNVSTFRTVIKIIGAGIIGGVIGTPFDNNPKSGMINPLYVLLVMVVAAVLIRFQWDQWFVFGGETNESPNPKDIPTDERNTDHPT